MNYISFTLENYHSPDKHYVRYNEIKNPLVIEEIKRKAKFDNVPEIEALEKLNLPASEIDDKSYFDSVANENPLHKLIYMYKQRNGNFKYGIHENGEIIYFH